MLTFHDRETAEQAKEYDEFAVDDGEVSRPMRVSLYVDYLKRKLWLMSFGSGMMP